MPAPISKGEKREVAKKWKNKPVSEDENITERKYFNWPELQFIDSSCA